ncbi:hypothetical protein [Thomasclavelia spiroformis]|uniref:hypothetical protein n=1 Tax=Thomasclavelia spiroformis TaxID=29348 RepID=UPI00255B70E4|nr:hypothetical protein [Thomasclavelia spiroformis]
MREDKSEDKNCNGRSPTALLCNLIPHKYICIDELWSDARRDIIKKVIGSVIGWIRFDVPDFELKWSDIPEEKIDEWIDFVFGYDTRLWKSYSSDRNPDAIKYNYSIENIVEERLYYLDDLITEYIVEKFYLREQVYGTHELHR